MTPTTQCPEHEGGEHFHLFSMPSGMYCWCGDRVKKVRGFHP